MTEKSGQLNEAIKVLEELKRLSTVPIVIRTGINTKLLNEAIDTVVEYCEKQLPCDCVIGFEGDTPVTHKLCDNCKSKIWGSVCPINSSIIIEKCVYRGEKCSVCIK